MTTTCVTCGAKPDEDCKLPVTQHCRHPKPERQARAKAAANPVCDFCSSPDVQWRFRCSDFVQTTVLAKVDLSDVAVVDAGMEGDWAACPACKALIEADDRERLLRRSVRLYARHHRGAVPLSMLEISIRPIHNEFFARKVGDPIPVERTR
jgi:hypothetical protein